MVIYLGISAFFIGHFYIDTEINGRDFSGKTVEDVEDYIKEQVQDYELTIVEQNNETDVIKGSDISLTYKENEDVQKALNRTSYELEDVTASAVRAQIEEAAETAIQDTENEYKVSVFLNDYTQPENVGDVATVTATITVTVGDESDTVDVLVSIEKIASSTGDGAETGD